MNTARHEICVVGGGMTGTPLALALAHLGFDVAVIEANPPQTHPSPSFDERCLALSYGSVVILSALGLWPMLAQGSTPIREIFVCEQGGLGQHWISADERNVTFLGEVVSARFSGEALWRQLDNSAVSVYAPMALTKLERSGSTWRLDIQGQSVQHTIDADLVIAADGQKSRTRALAGIGVNTRRYGQSAVIANVQTECDHAARALELFRPDGPLALLPFKDHWSLVYTVADEKLAEVEAWDDATFLKTLQAEVGWRYGKFLAVSQRYGYPLALTLANTLAIPGLWLAGNAAHSIHPIAGQGFNLGLRDVAWIIELLLWARHHSYPLSGFALAQRYVSVRTPDIQRIAALTDWLARGFRSQLPGLKLARSVLLNAFHACPLAEEWLARTAMGQQPPVPWLAAGLSLEALEDEVIYGCTATEH